MAIEMLITLTIIIVRMLWRLSARGGRDARVCIYIYIYIYTYYIYIYICTRIILFNNIFV